MRKLQFRELLGEAVATQLKQTGSAAARRRRTPRVETHQAVTGHAGREGASRCARGGRGPRTYCMVPAKCTLNSEKDFPAVEPEQQEPGDQQRGRAVKQRRVGVAHHPEYLLPKVNGEIVVDEIVE